LRYWAAVSVESISEGVSTLLRLRISIPDRPGALARVATIIASHGGNITSIDVQQATAALAVDELLVEFSDEPDAASLREELAKDGETVLVSQQLTERVDPIVASLRHVSELLESGFGDPEAALVRGVAQLCSSPVAWVSSAEEAARYGAGRFAMERQGVAVMAATELPAHLAERLPGEVCLLAVPDVEQAEGHRVIFVARPPGNEFTTTEVARIEALVGLHAALAKMITAGPDDRGQADC
jgi:predicted amino acid-binding ACT domain protein